MTLALNYGKEKEVNTIYLNGDIMDCYKASFHEQDPKKRDMGYEFEVCRQFLDLLKKEFPKAKIFFKQGNHECFDERTEILTKDGWKFHDEISMDDSFATYNTNSSKIEFQEAEKIHEYDYEGKMFSINTRGVNMLVTPNHRIYYKYGSLSDTSTNFEINEASKLELERRRITFACSGSMCKEENGFVTDDEIRICAWIHTDGSIFKRNNNMPCYLFYQRESKVKKITDILHRLGYKYSLKKRDREIKEICGRVLKKRNEPSCTIRVLRGFGQKHRLDDIIGDKYTIPSWVYELSDRQFDIFLQSFIDGDGSRHKSAPNSSFMIYGVKEMIDQMQVLCTLYGYRSTISEYRKNTWRLNITKNTTICVDGFHRKHKFVDYKGKVFCVTVPNGTVIVRRNGKVIISGNCRWERFLRVKAPIVLDMEEFRLEVILKLREKGIEWIPNSQLVKAGKLNMIHGNEYKGGGGINVARTLWLRAGDNVIAGDKHKTQTGLKTNIDKKVVGTWSVGCLCELNPDYMVFNEWNLGFAHIEIFPNGEFAVHNKQIINGRIL